MTNKKELRNRFEYYNELGQLHREDGPAIEYLNGSKEWWVNGKKHRKDGPALEYSNGTRYWYLNGNRHRLDGPAIEWEDGVKEWWVNGKELTEMEHKLLKFIKND